MTLYILKRVLLFIPTLLGITLITFVLMQSLPGDPVQNMVGERATPETIACCARRDSSDTGSGSSAPRSCS